MTLFVWVIYVFISWPFELLWEQVIRPLWEGPPTLTFELMKMVEQDPGLPAKARRMQAFRADKLGSGRVTL